jgi:hypothetical protein
MYVEALHQLLTIWYTCTHGRCNDHQHPVSLRQGHLSYGNAQSTALYTYTAQALRIAIPLVHVHVPWLSCKEYTCTRFRVHEYTCTYYIITGTLTTWVRCGM